MLCFLFFLLLNEAVFALSNNQSGYVKVSKVNKNSFDGLGSADFATSYYESRFVYADSELSVWLLRLCFLLGEHLSEGEFVIIIDQLLDILSDIQARKVHKEVVLLLNHMILGAQKNKTINITLLRDSFARIVIEYLTKERWYLPSSPHDFEAEGEILPSYISPALLDNGILVGLVIRGLAHIAQLLVLTFFFLLVLSIFFSNFLSSLFVVWLLSFHIWYCGSSIL